MNPIYHEYQIKDGPLLPEVRWTGDPNIDSLLARERWLLVARPNQIIPRNKNIFGYCLLSGRGFGKTIVGGHDIRDTAFEYPNTYYSVFNISADPLWKINFDGPSGFRSIIPESCIVKLNKRPAEVELWNGSRIWGMSADDPEKRGGEYLKFWLDEYAWYPEPETLLDNLVLSMRGKAPFATRGIITTTPRPIKAIFDIAKDPDFIKVFASTVDNRHNLDERALKKMLKLEGTRLGDQELHGRILQDDSFLLFKREWFQLYPAAKRMPQFAYIFSSWDTASTAKDHSNKTACTIWGVFYTDTGPALMLLGAWDEKMEYPAMRGRMKYEMTSGHGPNKDLFINTAVVEAKGHGLVLYQDLSQSFPVHPFNPGTKDKVTRAQLVSYIPERGDIYIPEDPNYPGEFIPYALNFLDEVTFFSKDPGALKKQEDDYTDTMTQAIKHVMDLGYMNSAMNSVAFEAMLSGRYGPKTTGQLVNPYRFR